MQKKDEINNETGIIKFPRGVYGFEGEKNFKISIPDKSMPLAYLQEISSNLRFIVVDAFSVFKDYDVVIEKYDADAINLEKEEDAIVLCIVNMKNPVQDSTVNLLAPLVINKKNKVGIQIIMDKSSYSVEEPLFLATKSSS
ncbi:Flagellar assembly factor fliW [Thermodesulfobium narugense DSM 14796]|uniref:Flagellar assembly factor FliW n=1 Tax=Thermodesulfobium narugense DSM 14796 TaxID=747365 RepID=M1E9H7_9BACT|nr:flagellar assembly protein FliW [Thermodesulfobium narugense]AEE15299.1 Flagellar assembly factor fliW [Thermodesulfobium narugense DSM 14796]